MNIVVEVVRRSFCRVDLVFRRKKNSRIARLARLLDRLTTMSSHVDLQAMQLYYTVVGGGYWTHKARDETWFSACGKRKCAHAKGHCGGVWRSLRVYTILQGSHPGTRTDSYNLRSSTTRTKIYITLYFLVTEQVMSPLGSATGWNTSAPPSYPRPLSSLNGDRLTGLWVSQDGRHTHM
jgi:hypothetical protein